MSRPELFDQLLCNPLLVADINMQAQVVQLLTQARMMASPAAEEMLQDAASCLSISAIRFELICSLEDPKDIRRALKVRKLPTPARLPDEQIYPTGGWLGRYMAWAEHMEVPLAWHFWAGLSLIAACSRRNYYFDSGNYRVWPAFYACLVGPSGGGKSLCLQSAAEPMLRRVNDWLLANPTPEFDDSINIIPDRLSTAAFLEQCQESMIADLNKEEEDVDVDVDDGAGGKTKVKRRRATGIKVHYKKRKDSTSVILQDELMSFVGKDMFDATSWIGLLLALSNGKDTFVNPTVSKRRVLTGVAVTALFASAPDNLRKLMPPAFHTGGLQGRFVWCYRTDSGRVYSVTPPLDPIERDHLAKWLAILSRMPELEVSRHPETNDWWEQFYAKWDEDKEIEPEFRSWHNRVKDQMVRVAMLLAVSNGRFVIRLEDLELAHGVLAKERSHFTSLFNQITDSREGELNSTILSALPNAPDWVGESFLCRKLLHSVGSVQQIERSLHLLLKAGEAQRGEKQVGTGKLKKTIRLWRRRPKGG